MTNVLKYFSAISTFIIFTAYISSIFFYLGYFLYYEIPVQLINISIYQTFLIMALIFLVIVNFFILMFIPKYIKIKILKNYEEVVQKLEKFKLLKLKKFVVSLKEEKNNETADSSLDELCKDIFDDYKFTIMFVLLSFVSYFYINYMINSYHANHVHFSVLMGMSGIGVLFFHLLELKHALERISIIDEKSNNNNRLKVKIFSSILIGIFLGTVTCSFSFGLVVATNRTQYRYPVNLDNYVCVFFSQENVILKGINKETKILNDEILILNIEDIGTLQKVKVNPIY